MDSLAISGLMLVCVLLSTLVAMRISRRLPDHHLTGETRDVVKLGLGVIGTLTAMVLGLLVAATKGTYDSQSNNIKDVASQMAVIDRVLARFGPETAEARKRLKDLAEAVLEQLWPAESGPHIDFTGGISRQAGEALFESIVALTPKTESQKLLKDRAQDLIVGLGQLRQRLVVNGERSIPMPLLVVLGVWQMTLFAGFGLLAPRNATSLIVLGICMISVAGALFLILELDRPFEGIVRISNHPIRLVMSHFGE